MKKILGFLVASVVALAGCSVPPAETVREEQGAAPAARTSATPPVPPNVEVVSVDGRQKARFKEQKSHEVPYAALQLIKVFCVKTSEPAQQTKAWVDKQLHTGNPCLDETVKIVVTDEAGGRGEGDVHVIGGMGRFEIPAPLRGDITITVTPKSGPAVSKHTARDRTSTNIAVAVK